MEGKGINKKIYDKEREKGMKDLKMKRTQRSRKQRKYNGNIKEKRKKR